MDILAIAAVAFTIAGFVKGVVGFGFPVITLIILTLTIGLLDALAIIIIPTIVTNVWQGLSGPHLKDIVRRMWLYFFGPLARQQRPGFPRSHAAIAAGTRAVDSRAVYWTLDAPENQRRALPADIHGGSIVARWVYFT